MKRRPLSISYIKTAYKKAWLALPKEYRNEDSLEFYNVYNPKGHSSEELNTLYCAPNDKKDGWRCIWDPEINCWVEIPTEKQEKFPSDLISEIADKK